MEQISKQAKGAYSKIAESLSSAAAEATPAEVIVEKTPEEQAQAKLVDEVLETPIKEEPKEVKAEKEIAKPKKEDVDKGEKAEKQPIKSAKEDIDADFYKEMFDEELVEQGAEAKSKEPKEPKEVKAEKETPQSIDPVYNDPLVQAVVNSIKAGKTNLMDIVKDIGYIDADTLSIGDIYRMEAQELGLEGTELEEAVAEQLENYDNLSRMDKLKAEKALRSSVQEKAKNKVSEYSKNIEAKNTEVQKEQELVQNTALDKMRQELEKLNGKFHKTLKIDDKMVEALKEQAPMYSPPVYDEKGKLVGYDVKAGIDTATYILYGKQMLRSAVNYGRSMGYDEAMKDKVRPNADAGQASSTAAAQPDNVKDTMKKYTDDLWKKRGFTNN